jgi:2-iminobutanoate/2-iminopropanoate deaminase
MSNLDIIATNEAPAAIGPYSQAVRFGNLLFTSGQIPLDLDGQVVTGGIVEQTHQVFQNLQAVLKASGCVLNDVIKATVFIKDMNQFSALNEVYASYFGDHKPARSTVEVARLPRDVHVEIELVVSVHVS